MPQLLNLFILLRWACCCPVAYWFAGAGGMPPGIPVGTMGGPAGGAPNDARPPPPHDPLPLPNPCPRPCPKGAGLVCWYAGWGGGTVYCICRPAGGGTPMCVGTAGITLHAACGGAAWYCYTVAHIVVEVHTSLLRSLPAAAGDAR